MKTLIGQLNSHFEWKKTKVKSCKKKGKTQKENSKKSEKAKVAMGLQANMVVTRVARD